MKSVLIILTRNDQSSLDCNESISALMLFASFNLCIHVLFKDAALSLLTPHPNPDQQLQQFLKPSYKMVNSFEFYDIEHLYVLEQDQYHPLLKHTPHHLQVIALNPQFLAQFDHIITW